MMVQVMPKYTVNLKTKQNSQASIDKCSYQHHVHLPNECANGWDPYIHRAMEYYSAINEALMQSTTLITQNTTLSQKTEIQKATL